MGAQVDAENSKGRDALSFAAQAGHVLVVSTLVTALAKTSPPTPPEALHNPQITIPLLPASALLLTPATPTDTAHPPPFTEAGTSESQIGSMTVNQDAESETESSSSEDERSRRMKRRPEVWFQCK